MKYKFILFSLRGTLMKYKFILFSPWLKAQTRLIDWPAMWESRAPGCSKPRVPLQGSTVEARKLEHCYPHSRKVKYRRSQH